jgi:hypothetical protein
MTEIKRGSDKNHTIIWHNGPEMTPPIMGGALTYTVWMFSIAEFI